jgi:hypothetical protein
MPDCPFNPDKIVGMLLLDKDKVFTAIETLTVAAFITALQAATVAQGEARIYPIFRFDGMTDSSEDAVKTTSGYGSETFVRDGKYKFVFDMFLGGHQLHQKIRKYNKSKKKCLLVDSNGTVMGTKNSDGLLTGFSMDYFNAKPFKFNDGANPAKYQLEICLSKPAELNENIGYIKTNLDVEEVVKGITDVTIELAPMADPHLLNVVYVSLYTTDDRINLFDLYASTLDETTAWIIKNSAGTQITVLTASSVDAAGIVAKAWKIGATMATGIYTIQLASSATLRAAPILTGVAPAGGFESNVLSWTSPAI